MRRALSAAGQGTDDRMVGADHPRILRRDRRIGFTACDTEQWLTHRGTVGKVLLGEIARARREHEAVPEANARTLWFKTATRSNTSTIEAHHETRSADGAMSTVGDIGYVDDDGFLYLTDRATFMIVCGGVNIYPQECENCHHPPQGGGRRRVRRAQQRLGEEIKAVYSQCPASRRTRRWRTN